MASGMQFLVELVVENKESKEQHKAVFGYEWATFEADRWGFSVWVPGDVHYPRSKKYTVEDFFTKYVPVSAKFGVNHGRDGDVISLEKINIENMTEIVNGKGKNYAAPDQKHNIFARIFAGAAV